MKRTRVAIIFGGQSAEHEVSIQSARSVYNALNKNKYEPLLLGITKSGKWVSSPNLAKLLQNPTYQSQIPANLPEKSALDFPKAVVFPVLHGPYGEDGTIQGLLKLANLPFVGAGVLGSAVGMDKEVQKRLLRDAGIPVAKFVALTNPKFVKLNKLVKKFDFPLFVKPANLGSSVGVTKVKSKKYIQKAIKIAFKYDTKVLVEEAIAGREIEISVLGNEKPIASTPGEVIPQGHEFYDYEAKYLDENGATLAIPARMTKKQVSKIQKLAIKAYKTLCCEGMARVDMFLTKNGKVYINEINTIPGFTSISMYPKLWEASGLSQTKLLDKLISLAIDRFKKEQKLRTSV